MPLDISLIFRKWAFDLDSEALGPIRIANADMQKIFTENEARIRAGELEGARLARFLFEKIAHKRTGDEEVDKTCQGPTFERSELEMLTTSELDLFADRLVKGRMRFVAPKGSAPARPNTETGCAALAGALIAYVDAARASRDETLKNVKRHLSAHETMRTYLSTVNQLEAQWKPTAAAAAAAAAGLTATSIIDAERARQEAQWRSMFGVESVVDNAVKDWKLQDEQMRTAMGYLGDKPFVKSIASFRQDEKLASAAALGYVSDSEIAKWMEQYERDQKLAATALGTIPPDMRGFAGMTTAERIGIASGPSGTIAEYLREKDMAAKVSRWGGDAFEEQDVTVREIRPPAYPHPPPNPAHETNKIVGELLGHQKEMEAKKEAESVATNATSKSSLRYTKAGFWCAVVVAVFSIGTTIWVYFDQKADAAENAKAAAAESGKQRAEISELTAALRKSIESKPSVEPIAKAVRAK